MEEILRSKVPELKRAEIPRCEFSDVFKEAEDGEKMLDEEREAISAYLRIFLPPSRGVRCVCCGTEQGGMLAALTGSGFTWGMAHGEGSCGTCGYPARAYHRNFGPIEFVQFVLQYHPDELTMPEEKIA